MTVNKHAIEQLYQARAKHDVWWTLPMFKFVSSWWCQDCYLVHCPLAHPWRSEVARRLLHHIVLLNYRHSPCIDVWFDRSTFFTYTVSSKAANVSKGLHTIQDSTCSHPPSISDAESPCQQTLSNEPLYQQNEPRGRTRSGISKNFIVPANVPATLDCARCLMYFHM